MRSGRHSRRGAVAACSAAIGLVMLVAACGPISGSSSGPAPNVGDRSTVTFAMQPGGQAAYPFPFMGSNQLGFDSVFNVDEFQYLLYRPLYFFGNGVTPYMNPKVSLALPPIYHGNQVIIRLKKNYQWSNGEPIEAKDVVFWMNMMKAEGTNDAYFNTTGLPTDVTNVRVTSKYVVTMDITPPFSESWFSNNELSEITPMPLYWDRTSVSAAPGSGGCSKASYASIRIDDTPAAINPKTQEPTMLSASAKACNAVFNYLTAQSSKNASTFASSPLWSIVDGPWKIQKLDSQGHLTLTYNSHYSGPVPPGHITKFIEQPFTSEAAEFNVLQDPNGPQTIDVGYLPTVDAPSPAAGAEVGANPSSLPDYKLSVLYPWQLTYFPYNFKNTTGQGAIFAQQYFRQAFQSLVDQEGVINGPLHGYGKPIFGPVSDVPPTKYISPSVAKAGDKWTLNIKNAEHLLSGHGWTIQPNGTDRCARGGTGPGHCGAKIPTGTQLKLNLIYASGIDWMQSAMRELASNASLAGIQLTVKAEPFGNVVDTAFGISPACTATNCAWQMAFWGTWTYAPDYLPTGDVLFEGGAPNNAGNYNDPKDNKLISATLQARTPAEFEHAMYAWQNYVADQLPVVYQPDYPTLIESIKGLDIGPLAASDTILPEEWHYLK